MGQKANPKSLRVGIINDWDSTWFGLKNYGTLLFEDYQIRDLLKDAFNRAGVSHIQIDRKANLTEVKVYVARSGVVVGKKGLDVPVMKEEIKKRIGKDVNIIIIDEKTPDINAKLLGEWIAIQLEKRTPFRRAMKMAVQKALKSGAKGIKVNCSGRLGGAEIARSEWSREGKVPLHTFRADIDYAFSEALTTYGKIGVKVWVYKGEVLQRKRKSLIEESTEHASTTKG
ncbi:MAG: 30S ribosomal protein S3 [Candidatus Margulisbacteria bacterium]|nr:30S ribosomal protein S3 [Candidatus Margulisiibacteriota bacterium]